MTLPNAAADSLLIYLPWAVMAAGGNLLHGWSALTWATASLGAPRLQGQGAVLASWAPPQLVGPAS